MDSKRHDSRKFIEQIKRELAHAIKTEEVRRLKSILNSIRSSNAIIAGEPLEPNGYTALHLAAACGFEEGVTTLLDFGVQVNATSSWGETALHVAIESQFNGIVDSLLQTGECEIDLKTKSREETALGIAARVGNASAVRQLIQHGASVDDADKEGNSPLHHAVLKARYEIAKDLLCYGADSKLKNYQHRTPLYLAMKVMNDARLTEILVKQKATMGAKGAPGGEAVSHNSNKWELAGGNKASRNPAALMLRKNAASNAAAKSETSSMATMGGMPPMASQAAAVRASRASVFRTQHASEKSDQLASPGGVNLPHSDRNANNAAAAQRHSDRNQARKARGSEAETSKGAREEPERPEARGRGAREDADRTDARQRAHKADKADKAENERAEVRQRRANMKSACVQTGPEVENAFRQRQPPKANPSDAYPMHKKPRGICLIFSNETYWHDDFKERSGADVDERRLNRLFSAINFKVKIHKNLNAAEIFWEVVNIAKNTDHSAYDCFVCCILSHGSLGTIYGVDGDSFRISDLTIALTASRCPSLAGKPKMFFIQSCRGDDYQAGYDYEHDALKNGEVSRIIPDHADFLLGYATVAGYRAQRHRTDGSIYIKTLCAHIEKEGKTNDLLSILTKVNAQVSVHDFEMGEGTMYKQMPEVRHTLTRKIFLG